MLRQCLHTSYLVAKPLIGDASLVEVKNGLGARLHPEPDARLPPTCQQPGQLPTRAHRKGWPETLLVGYPKIQHWGTMTPI